MEEDIDGLKITQKIYHGDAEQKSKRETRNKWSTRGENSQWNQNNDTLQSGPEPSEIKLFLPEFRKLEITTKILEDSKSYEIIWYEIYFIHLKATL